MRHRSPRLLVPIVLGLALASAASSQTAPEVEVRDADAREATAMRQADLAALAAIWSEDFVVNAPDGRVKSRDEVLASVRDGRIRYSAFERRVDRVTASGDTWISMGGETIVPTGDRPDAGRTLERRYSRVWQRIDGAWRLVARHANVQAKPD